MSKIYLYAEILANIRQVSLYASLHTDRNDETKIDVSSDRRIITVLHGDDRASIFLPTGIGGSAEVTLPAEKKTELSIRLEIADLADLPAADQLRCHNEYPWVADDLGRETRLRCRACEGELVGAGAVGGWKDLPSEGWAEMMDLWHCHKPQDEQGDGDGADAAAAAEKKGFGSTSRITASSHVGLVDIYSFLFDREDCENVQLDVSTITENPRKALSCKQCNASLGFEDESANGWRLHKSSVALQPSKDATWESFPATTFVCAQLLALIESQATRKFVLHSGPDDTTGAYLLWVFNPDLLYSSSRATPATHRAMKIFYRALPDHPQSSTSSSFSSLLDEHEELRLSAPVLSEFTAALTHSTDLLPLSARTYQDWTVGLLDRYQKDPAVTGDVDRGFKPLFTGSGDAAKEDGDGEGEGDESSMMKKEGVFMKVKRDFDAEFAPLYT